MGLFSRKKPTKDVPENVVEVRKHQKALKYFWENQSSMGVYGDSTDLSNAKLAIVFFAYKPLDHIAHSNSRDVNVQDCSSRDGDHADD